LQGTAITLMWRGKPLFVRHRTAAEIAAAEETDLSMLRDPEPDEKARKCVICCEVV
jgi:ubiquinol-cytochrome c reductase iron-sulfur subunit